MVARALAYVLLVVTCTLVAAMGGYEIGTRVSPGEQASVAEREAALRQAVHRAVVKQKAADRRVRREALRNLAAFQREKFEGEMAARVSEVRLAEAANAARAFRRGRVAGRATAVKAAEAEAEADDAADVEADAAAQAAAAADETDSTE